ncbi:ferrochelatase, partial [Candidatus Zixiibacteriota bacterium]
MSFDTDQKTCLILLGMGGPDSVGDVGDFLYNIFSDRSIIKLPGGKLFQKPLAKFISRMRLKKVQANYTKIGGGSPLLKWTQAQKDNIDFSLAPILPGFKSYIGMRYFKPYINDAIEQAYADGFKSFVFLPLYPQYCRATTGSSFEVTRKIIAEHPEVTAKYIDDFHDDKNYIRILAECINNNIKDDEILLFSAHSIPQKFVDDGDPYVEQVKQTAKLSAGNHDYHLAFQSRTGPVKWVEPDT